jgi:hypothetical protein
LEVETFDAVSGGFVLIVRDIVSVQVVLPLEVLVVCSGHIAERELDID